MKHLIKKFKRRFDRIPAVKAANDRRMLGRWHAGKLGSPPHIVKVTRIKELAKRSGITTFIETGTYLGDTVNAVKDTFDKIYSIELSKDLYKEAVDRFKGEDSIQILHGDSPNVLPSLLPKIDGPIMFWLDAHYSGGVTALSERGVTPIERELDIILDSWRPGSIILIDDARLFTGTDNYPTIETVKDQVEAKNPSLSFERIDDFLKIG